MGYQWRLGFLLLVGSLCAFGEESAPAEFSGDALLDMMMGDGPAGGYGGGAGHAGNYSGNHGYVPYPGYPGPSPWHVVPGTYTKDSYGGSPVYSGHGFSAHGVYASYLNSPAHASYNAYCSKSYGQYPKISVDDLNNAFAYARAEIGKYNALENKAHSSGNYLNATSHGANARHQVASFLSRNQYIKEKEAMFMEYASLYLLKHHCLSKYHVNYILPQVKITVKTGNPYGDESCYSGYGYNKTLKCRDSKYRAADGSCNNLYHPYWGKSNVCHIRLVPADYKDGLHIPRHSSYGKELPNARVISNVALPDVSDRAYYTHLKMAFGQYINHDITFTPVTQADYGSGVLIKCCPNSYHPQCYPIRIPLNDYYLGKYKKTCMNFVRSAPCPLCTLGPRNQKNIGTSFLDQSATYGSDRETEKRLRTYSYGLMKTGRDKYGHEIMPPTPHAWQDQCSAPYKNMLCFDSGDVRINQHPALMDVHLIWLRRHNMHARALYRVNPKWNDERLFQEARRLSVAELQLITYGEYLDLIFGPTLMKYFSLDVRHPGYTYYEPHTDPTTWNDYATAACRFGHSQINSFHSLIGTHGVGNYTYGGYKNNSINGFYLRDWFFDPSLIYEGWHDNIILGLVHDRSQVVDPWFTNDIKNYLYRTRYEKSGSDLPAFNIQRGRDHGIPGYHVYLNFCFGFKAYSWNDLGKFIPYYQLKILMGLYDDWRDVDLWVAGMSERKFPDADVGPTFACILGIQYYHLKFGDRYFVTHGYQTGSFTPAQLSNLRAVTKLSSVICKTGDYIKAVQKHAFFPASSYNPQIACTNYPEVDYSLWKEAY